MDFTVISQLFQCRLLDKGASSKLTRKGIALL